MKNSLFLLSTSKTLALLMFCGAMNISCDAQIRKPKIQPPPTGIAAEANRMATEWKANTFRQCTDNSGNVYHYTKEDEVASEIKKTGSSSRTTHRSPIVLYEIKDMSFSPMNIENIPELERLNGLEWRGWVEIQPKYYRTFSTETGAWSKWGDGVMSKLVKATTYGRIIFTKRRDSELKMEGADELFSAPTCDEVQEYYDGSYQDHLRREGMRALMQYVKSRNFEAKMPDCLGNGTRFLSLPDLLGNGRNNKIFAQVRTRRNRNFVELIMEDDYDGVFGLSKKNLTKRRTFATINVSAYRLIYNKENQWMITDWKEGSPVEFLNILPGFIPKSDGNPINKDITETIYGSGLIKIDLMEFFTFKCETLQDTSLRNKLLP